MKIVKIHYYHTFPILKERGIEQWQKIGLEAELDENDDVRQSLYSLKKQVENFHYESKAAAEKQMGTHIMPDRNWNTNPYTYQEVAGVMNLSLEEQIQSCTDKKVLESYRMIVKNNPELEKIYLEKLKEFV